MIRSIPQFRLFATANTVGLGDTSGLYHCTQQINQGQMDRWNIVVTLNYLPAAVEAQTVLAKSGEYDQPQGKATVGNMVRAADLTWRGFINGDIATAMSPRTVISWAQVEAVSRRCGQLTGRSHHGAADFTGVERIGMNVEHDLAAIQRGDERLEACLRP